MIGYNVGGLSQWSTVYSYGSSPFAPVDGVVSTAVTHDCHSWVFARLPCNVTIMSEAILRRLGPVDMVIAGCSCQGHSRAKARQGLEDPR